MLIRFLTALLIFSTFSAYGLGLGESYVKKNSDSEKTFSNYNKEDRLQNGHRIHQFVDQQRSRVFATSWTGSFDETVKSFLGSHAADLAKHDQEHPPRSGRIAYRKVETGGAIFEFWDMPKMMRGRAYIPSQFPANVTTENID